MLVLSRKIGEKVVVPGCALTLTILAVDGNRVRLGIAAPPDVLVLREEICGRPDRRGAREASPGTADLP